MEWISDNWQYVLLVFYTLEKVVKASPSRFDDILLDMVWGALKKVVGKSKK
jgi:hypothetical protein|tara:strand:- start:22 stop:174 length:153 start_codon:yes stop_codon:yes gene_type:complete